MSDNRKQRRIAERREEAGKRLRREEIKFKMMENKNPVVTSLAFMTMWVVVLIIILIAGTFSNKLGILWNINTVSIVGFIISALWALMRAGMFESILFKYKKFKDLKIVKKQHINVPSLTKEEYKKFVKNKSWIGIIVMALISILSIVITTILLNV